MERPTFKMHADKDKIRYLQNSGFQGWKSWMDKYLDGHNQITKIIQSDFSSTSHDWFFFFSSPLL